LKTLKKPFKGLQKPKAFERPFKDLQKAIQRQRPLKSLLVILAFLLALPGLPGNPSSCPYLANRKLHMVLYKYPGYETDQGSTMKSGNLEGGFWGR